MQPLVIVFAKSPQAGKVKTRLGLSPQQALHVHQHLVEDVWRRVTQLPGIDAALYTDQATPAWPQIETRGLQGTGDLGERMSRAIGGALDAGRPRVMIVGGDIPDLPVGYLQTMLESPADVTLGPTADGGYYAIACRRWHGAMFAGVAWSTEQALAQTKAACERCGLTVATGPAWHDLDTPADIGKLSDSLRQKLGL
jgi:uncharacterized protein